MRRKSILPTFVILLLIVALLAACGSNNNNAVNTPSEAPASTPDASATPEPELTPDQKPTLKWLISSSFYDVEADAGAKITREVSGYNIEFEVISGVEQLMLIISSGEAYDYVFLNNDNYNLLMNNDALLDITDLLKDHGSNITDSITTLWPRTTTEGRIYGIPSTIAQPNSLLNSIVARGDLMESAGISTPTTIDGFYETLVALKKAYPKMIPLTTDVTRGYFIPNLAGAFGISGDYQDLNGVITPIIKNPKLKEYITFMSKLYSEGLLDAEMPALTEKDKIAKLTSSKAVMMVGTWNGIETPIGAIRGLVPGVKAEVMPIMKGQDGTQVVEMRSGVGAIGGIPVTSKNPTDSIKAINAIIDLENFTKIALGEEGVHHSKTADGGYELIQPAFNEERVNSNVFISGFYREDIYPKMWEARLSKNADLASIFKSFKASIEGIAVKSPVSLAPPVTVVDNKAALETYVKDSLNAIVAGVNPIDNIDKIIKYWDDNGGKKIEEFYNEWYAN